MYNIEEIYLDIKNGATLSLIYKRYGGTNLYIPKVDPNFREKIINEFNGYNHLGLAHKFNVSLNTVYRIIRENKKRDLNE